MKVSRRWESILLAGASWAALSATGVAHAQANDDDDDDRARTLGTVTVTATRREESIQDVPIAVTALAPEQLERAGVQDLRSLDRLSASFNLNSSQTESQGTTIRIRGIGTTGNNIGLESAVGVFVDGVFLSRPGVALGDLLDLQQIEVLRGPQGTLFGRNTSAGALNITTQAPNLDEAEGFANFTYGNFDQINAQAGFSVPLIEDQLAFRLSAAFRERDGFVQSSTGAESNNRDRWLVRGQVFWQPTDNFSFRLIGDVSEANESCCDAIFINESALTSAFTAPLPAALGGPLEFPDGGFAFAGLDPAGGVTFSGFEALNSLQSNAEQFENPFEQWGLSGEINWDLGAFDVTYIGSFRNFIAESIQESDFNDLEVFSIAGSTSAFPVAPAFDDIETLTQEIRFNGTAFDDRVDWLFGFYYSDEEIEEISTLTLGADFQQAISPNFFPLIGASLGTNPALVLAGGVDANGSFATNRFFQDGQSFSFFTDNTIAVTDKFDFSFGIRYVNESKDGLFEQLDASSDACLSVLEQATLAAAPDSTSPLAPFAGDTFELAAALTCFPFATVADVPGTLLPTTFDTEFDDDEIVWTVRGAYDVTPNINAYVSFAHGFKAGGFNLDPTAAVGFVDPATGVAFPGDPTFGSETIDSFEGGIKTDLFGGRVRANVAAFHSIISDFQVLEFTGVQFTTFNVDTALSTGVEVEVEAQVTDNLSVNTALTFADARYPDDCNGDSTSPIILNLCGSDLTNAPEFVGIAGFTYEDSIPNTNLSFFFTGSGRYENARRTSTQPTFIGTDIPLPLDIQAPNAKVDLRLGIGSEDGRWTIEGWVNNLTDNVTRNVTFNIPLRGGSFLLEPFGGDGAAAQARGSFIQDPRTFGVTVRTEF